LQDDVRQKLTVHLVENLNQVINLALISSDSKERVKKNGRKKKTSKATT
ncbi:MAG: hypothetical protein ABGX31_05025, partial [bacterium]